MLTKSADTRRSVCSACRELIPRGLWQIRSFRSPSVQPVSASSSAFLPVTRRAPICPTFVAARKTERGAAPSPGPFRPSRGICARRTEVAAGASSLSYVTGRLVDDALCLPRKTYEKETFAAIDFRASLPVTSPKSPPCFCDSNRPGVPPSLIRFLAGPFVPRIRDRIGAIGCIFYGGLIIIAIAMTGLARTCGLRLQGLSLCST